MLNESVRKVFCLILVLSMAFAIFTLTGCSKKDVPESKGEVQSDNEKKDSESKDGGSEKEPEKVTIRLLTRWSSTASRDMAFKQRIQDFMNENSNITVEDESVNDENTYNNKFKTAVATGNVQELWINYGGESFKEYVKNNVAIDLEPILDEDKEWSDKFLPLFDSWRYEDIKGTYGIPVEFYAIAIYYNKDIFDKINSEPPKYVEDMPELAKKLKDIGVVPMMLGEKDNFRGGHLLANLSIKKFGHRKSIDLAKRTARYDDPEFVELFKLMKQWQDLGIFGKNMVTTDGNAVRSAFFNGKSAMMFDGTWALEELAESPLAGKIGVIPFPGFKDNPEFQNDWMGGAGGMSMSAAVTGTKKDAAVKLLKYLVSSEAFTFYQTYSKGGIFPAKTTTDPNIIDAVTYDISKLVESANDMRPEIQNFDPLPQIMDKARNEIQGMFAGNDPEKAAKAIQAEIDRASK